MFPVQATGVAIIFSAGFVARNSIVIFLLVTDNPKGEEIGGHSPGT
ncbi:hypothetical protein FRUB_00282 [Fimbriiglobus ruber]|uniref:Uncharacterized protein n=1 Tax=Fimbriiglobus ruber TaxID=1908690 RepID=A0A225E032_9BACT|nr:hypothetical protein FRUB_00282 [Fimbriiglobus ruber]